MHKSQLPIVHGWRVRARERGIVMFISLIVMVALSLAAIALIRSVDTSTTVMGNLAFRLASIQPGNAAVESAAAALFFEQSPTGVARITDTTLDNSNENYFASRQPNEDPHTGVPFALQTKTRAGSLHVAITDAATSNRVTYVIERMCTASGLATNGNCDMMPPKQNTGETIGDPTTKLPNIPFYRVTVRVDGPSNTTSFVQAMLR
jgi:type IV pilus assembly protein PilX